MKIGLVYNHFTCLSYTSCWLGRVFIYYNCYCDSGGFFVPEYIMVLLLSNAMCPDLQQWVSDKPVTRWLHISFMVTISVANIPPIFHVPIFRLCHMFVLVAEFPSDAKFPAFTRPVANFTPLGSDLEWRQSLAESLDGFISAHKFHKCLWCIKNIVVLEECQANSRLPDLLLLYRMHCWSWWNWHLGWHFIDHFCHQSLHFWKLVCKHHKNFLHKLHFAYTFSYIFYSFCNWWI